MSLTPPLSPQLPTPPSARPSLGAALKGLTVGLIGCGNMGAALARGWVRAGALTPDQLLLTARTSAPPLAAELGARAVSLERVACADVIVLGVKPQQLADLDLCVPLASAAERCGRSPLIISLLAGTSLAVVRQTLSGSCSSSCGWGSPDDLRLARAMPNLPAQVGLGATLLFAPPSPEPNALTNGDREVVSALFNAVGLSEWLASEELFHAGTALSGCGPAYLFIAAEALADAGVLLGLPRAMSQRLAAQTLYGSGALALTAHPAALKDGVTSPGGVTIAGVRALEQRAFRAALIEAVVAAADRSRALAGR